MQFTEIELSAVAKMAFDLAAADGKISETESSVIADGFTFFDVPAGQARAMITMAALVDPALAGEVVSRMTPEQKELVTAWLICVVTADRHVDSRETAAMKEFARKYGLPDLTTESARRMLGGRWLQAKVRDRR